MAAVIAAEVKTVASVAVGRMAAAGCSVEATVMAAEGEIEMGELGAELTAEESEGWRSGAFTIQPPPGRGQAVTTGAGCGYIQAW